MQFQSNSFSLWLIDDEKDIFTAMLPGVQEAGCIRTFRWFPGCQDALEALEHEPSPDIILLDIYLQMMNGLDALPLFRKASPETKIIVLTVDRQLSNLFRATKGGVSGYLLKPFRMQEVLSACEHARAGNVSLDPEITAEVVQHAATDQRSFGEYGLTQMEQRVVRLAVSGLTNKQISGEVRIALDTVKGHFRRVFEKMHVQSRGQLIAKVLREHLQ